MGIFDKAPYSFKNLIKGALAARANGEPYSGYKYAVAFQQEDDERFGPRTPSVANRVFDAASEETLRDVSRRAMEQWYTQKGRDLQYIDDGCKVEVRSGYHRDGKRHTTDILVFERSDSRGLHLHLVLDDQGNVVTEHWKTQKK